MGIGLFLLISVFSVRSVVENLDSIRISLVGDKILLIRILYKFLNQIF